MAVDKVKNKNNMISQEKTARGRVEFIFNLNLKTTKLVTKAKGQQQPKKRSRDGHRKISLRKRQQQKKCLTKFVSKVYRRG